ncbi:hypothetical protein OIU85_023092 [Salix viminalis]|uniref:Uncharacterized protein n=1 Tax=Salix viminalis TaxID=40686 RepID=A0A9Q0U878_SALVM|nr:hypothetical protein OIU85_023092 [Salix viminalis]
MFSIRTKLATRAWEMTCRQVFCMLGISSRVLLSSEEVEDVEAVGEELTSIWLSVLGLGCGWGLLCLSFLKKRLSSLEPRSVWIWAPFAPLSSPPLGSCPRRWLCCKLDGLCWEG